MKNKVQIPCLWLIDTTNNTNSQSRWINEASYLRSVFPSKRMTYCVLTHTHRHTHTYTYIYKHVHTSLLYHVYEYEAADLNTMTIKFIDYYRIAQLCKIYQFFRSQCVSLVFNRAYIEAFSMRDNGYFAFLSLFIFTVHLHTPFFNIYTVYDKSLHNIFTAKE